MIKKTLMVLLAALAVGSSIPSATSAAGMTWPQLTRDSVLGNSNCAPGACDNDRYQEKKRLESMGWCMSTNPGNYWASTVYDVTNRTDILWFYVTCAGYTIKVRFALSWNGSYSDWRVSEIFP